MKRKSEREIKEELRLIYAGKDGTVPDLTKLERRNGSRLTRILTYVVIFLLVVSAAAWGGFFLWSRGGLSPDRPLETSTELPERVRSGEEAFYTFRYENTGNSPIASLQVKLTLPPDFSLTSTNPEPTGELTWNVGSLARGSDGSITIGGVFRSEVPSTETLQALYTYKPANFSSDFQDLATAKVEISESNLHLTIDGPEKALPGDEVTYVINVQNDGTRDAENVAVGADLPEAFSVSSSEPTTAKPDVAFWTFDRLVPGELKAVTFKGTYTSSASGTQTMKTRAAFLDSDDTEFVQARAETQTEALNAALTFHLVINGSSSDQTIDPGGTLRASIDYANGENESVRGLSFSLKTAGDAGALPIDWTRATLDGGTRSENTITWDETALPELAELSPGASGTIDLSLPVLSTLPPNASGSVQFSLAASIDQVGSIASPRTIEASPIRVNVNSDFRASAHARYYSEAGEAIGTGPLPPTVGETTKYRVVWRVANSFHPLKALRMTANLPSGVSWTENARAEIGTIGFDETTRTVTWSVDALPTSIAGAEATFDVAITPGSDDVGSFYTLTNATAVEATDTVTGDQVSDAMDILTTELPEDTEAAGKGVVVQ